MSDYELELTMSFPSLGLINVSVCIDLDCFRDSSLRLPNLDGVCIFCDEGHGLVNMLEDIDDISINAQGLILYLINQQLDTPEIIASIQQYNADKYSQLCSRS
jgi:hypothetical protein